ncbi:PucR family transcriptional regulator [Streptomyces sp. MAR4 CNX-425]|uniref:PucR family transcriptional regulator n=1 Tax=Streptomyces sp. MAR4 CNX-425 TaxID=3406343 RepID=UPI003B50E670
MTRDNTPLCVGGGPVDARLRARVPALTRRVVDRLLAELPVYAALPPEEVAGDIADIVQRSLRLFADVLQRRGPARDDELVRQRESAAQRAEEGVPLDAILSAYQIGTAMGWEEISAEARPADLADVQEVLTHLFVLQRQLVSAVSAAYLEARQVLDVQEHAPRHALLAALLAGEPLEGIARRTGLRPAPRYVAMTLHVAPHPDEHSPGSRARIAARRKIRRLQTALNGFAGEPALTALDAGGGTALLPVPVPEEPAWAALCGLIDRTALAVGAPVTAAAAEAAPDGLPAAVAQTADIVELVRRTDRPPGLYRLADVLLDYQLSRPSEALAGLAELLEPLAGRPELLHTLETYLARDLDRRGTAAALHVHPNTVDYRIRRIARLTGLTPTAPADARRLSAALVARRTLRA